MTVDEERELRGLEELERLENMRDPQRDKRETQEKVKEAFCRAFGEDFDIECLFSEVQPFEQSKVARMAEYQTLEKSYREALAALKCNLSEPMRTQLKILLVSGAAMERCRERHFFRQGMVIYSERVNKAMGEIIKIMKLMDRCEKRKENQT